MSKLGQPTDFRPVARGWLLIAILAALLFRLYGAYRAQALSELVVTKTEDSDDGTCDADCSLREAISAANLITGDNRIVFNIPAADEGCSDNNVCTIPAGLVAVSDESGKTTIDGTGAEITLRARFYVDRADAALTLRELTVSDGWGSFGGAILNYGTTIVENSSFSNNQAQRGGAIFSGGVVVISNSTFSNNTAFAVPRPTSGVEPGLGGAIYSYGELSVINSTFSSNTAESGFGGAILGASAAISNSTFYGNSSRESDGAVEVKGGEHVLTLTNSILAGSLSGKNCASYFGQGSIGDGGGNVSDDASCAFVDPTSLNETDSRVDSALSDNGGATLTHALREGSPAIDSAVNEVCPATDQRGMPRPLRGGCDRGAYELEERSYLPAVLAQIVLFLF